MLHDGESLSAFVEESVRAHVRRRLDQAEFLRRGQASLADARRHGGYVSADEVLSRLEARIAQARRAQADGQHNV